MYGLFSIPSIICTAFDNIFSHSLVILVIKNMLWVGKEEYVINGEFIVLLNHLNFGKL